MTSEPTPAARVSSKVAGGSWHVSSDPGSAPRRTDARSLAVRHQPRGPGLRARHRRDERGLQHLQRRAAEAAAVSRRARAGAGLRHAARLCDLPGVVPEVHGLEGQEHRLRGHWRIDAGGVHPDRRRRSHSHSGRPDDGVARRRLRRAAAARPLVHGAGGAVRRPARGRALARDVDRAVQRRPRHRRARPDVRRQGLRDHRRDAGDLLAPPGPVLRSAAAQARPRHARQSLHARPTPG